MGALLVLIELGMRFCRSIKFKLTSCGVFRAGYAPEELLASSFFSFALGFEKDLKMLGCSRFEVAGLSAGLLTDWVGALLLDDSLSEDCVAVWGGLLAS